MDTTWIDISLSIAIGVALAAAAGMRVFLPLLVLGGAARLEWVPLAAGFEWLSSGWGLTALSVAVVLEVGAYYVPWVDNALDTIAGPLAVGSGVLAVAAVTTDLSPELRWVLAVIAGGGAAGAVQGLTSLARLKSTATTGGLANPLLATLELIGSLVTALVAVVVPLAALALVVGLVVLIRRVGRRLLGRRPGGGA